MGDGVNVYESGKQKLDAVIREYDQAVFDLTARVVASSNLINLFDASRYCIPAENGSKAETRRFFF